MEIPEPESGSNNTRPEPAQLKIVGIGASAGGLEALESFFRAVPVDSGVAFVVVQHLSPDFKSHMGELLGRQTSVPVRQVVDEMRVEPNSIYLIPANKEMVIHGGRLLLSARRSDRAVNYPIDQFLASLATDAGDRAIAVILSGTGSDGSRGLVDIHDAGGLVYAQEESTAKFDGMPMSAIATGTVDLVLPPDAIANSIMHFTRQGMTKEALIQEERNALSPVGVEKIGRLLNEKYGIDFSQYKPGTIGRRIDRRMQLSSSESLEAYATLLASSDAELNLLYEDLLIGVTKFFRDVEAFESLRTNCINKLLEDTSRDSIRIWCSACATGEEAYSIAMLIDEECRERGRTLDVKIFATDAHSRSLEIAANGAYPESSMKGMTEHRKNRYFRRTSDGYQVTRSLRDYIVFAPHNLLNDAPFTQMDLVTCRNMLIYLQPQAQKKALSMFHFALKAEGILFLGLSESPGELSDEFKTIDAQRKLYHKRRNVRLPIALDIPLGRRMQRMPRYSVPSSKTRRSRVDSDMIATYDQLLAHKMGSSILVSESGEMLHVFGGAERFLKSRGGRPSNQVLEMIDQSLQHTVALALHHASAKNQAIRQMSVIFQGGDGPEDVRISAEPLCEDGKGPNNILITLEPTGRDVVEPTETEITTGEMHRDRVEGLETELRYSQENLQAALEEMETSNEELQASNEELVASNEELQSTNEELHSVNEELYTVNAEHQRRVEELARANDDMDNLLATTRVGVIFLDKEFYIRRFTPEIEKVFDLSHEDLGRSIKRIRDALNRPQLNEELRRVYETQTDFECRVVADSGTPYLLRALPYQSSDMTDGVVMTLVDVTPLWEMESEIELQQRAIEAAVDGIIITNPREVGHPIRYANQGFLNLTGYKREEVLGRNCKFLQCEDTDQAEVNRIREALDAGEAIRTTVLNRRKDGRDFWNDLQIAPVLDHDGKVRNFVGVQHDITDQVNARKALEKANKAAERANEAKSTFLATMSHELRTPLTAVLGFADILKSDSKDEGTLEKIETIRRNGSYLLALLNDILDLSKIEAGKLRFDQESIDIRGLLKEVEILLQVRAKEAGLPLRFDREGALPRDLTADEVRVRQIIVNLVSNAIKFTKTGEILVRAEIDHGCDEPRLCVSVVDTGIGITPEQQENLFDPFYQASTLTSSDEGGAGLGLSICRRLAEGMGGTIEVESTIGEGSRFTLCLPLTAEQVAGALDQEKAEAQFSKSTASRENQSVEYSKIDARILLVDDRRDIISIGRHFLTQCAIDVTTASDGQQAIDQVEQAVEQGQPFDLLLMDMQMPIMGGEEAVQILRKRNHKMPIIAMTADAMEGERQACIAMGCTEYFPKPIDGPRLIELITRTLEEAKRTP